MRLRHAANVMRLRGLAIELRIGSTRPLPVAEPIMPHGCTQ